MFLLLLQDAYKNTCNWFSFAPRLMVFASCAMALAVACAHYQWSCIWLFFTALVGWLLAWGLRRWLLSILLFALPFMAFAHSFIRIPRPDANDISCLSFRQVYRQEISFRGVVLEIWPSNNSNSLRMLVQINKGLSPATTKISGKTLLKISSAGPKYPRGKNNECFSAKFSEGNELEIKGKIVGLRKACFPWEFDLRNFLAYRGIFSCVCADVGNVKISNFTNSSKLSLLQLSYIPELLTQWRRQLILAHRKILGEIEGDLLSAMVIGNKAVMLPQALTRKFQDLGLAHILAASGFNLTIVIGITWWLGTLVVRSVWAVNVLCFLAMLMFIGLTGPSPSVIRAAIMCFLLLLSRCLFRSPYPLAVLAFALAVTLLADPNAIVDIGFQLSYIATAGIICGAERISKRISILIKSLTANMPRIIADTLAVIVIAQASVLPLQLYYFWQAGLFCLVANVLVAPVIPVLTVAGFISSVVAIAVPVLPWLDTVMILLDNLAHYPLQWLLGIVSWLGSFQAGKITTGPPVLLMLVIYYGCLIGFFLLSLSKYWLPALGLFLVSLGGLFWHEPLPDLTIACFRSVVVMLDDKKNAYCFGNCNSGEARRFIAYYGGILQSPHCIEKKGVRDRKNVLFFYAKQNSLPVLLLYNETYQEPAVSSLPKCAAVIIYERSPLTDPLHQIESWIRLIKATQSPLVVISCYRKDLFIFRKMLAGLGADGVTVKKVTSERAVVLVAKDSSKGFADY